MNGLHLTLRFLAAISLVAFANGAAAAPEGVLTDIGVNIYDITDPVGESTTFDYYVEVENFDSLESAFNIDISVLVSNGFPTGTWFDLEGGDWLCTPNAMGIDCAFDSSTGGPAGDGIFPPGYQSTFKFEVMAPTGGSVQGDANVTNTSPPDGFGSNDFDSELTGVTSSGNVSLRIDSLSGVPDPVIVGNDITYTVNASYYDDLGDPLDFSVFATGVAVDITPQDPGAIANPVSDANWTCFLASRGPVGSSMTCTLNNPLAPGSAVPPLVQTVTAPGTPGMLQTDFFIYANEPEVNTSDNMAFQLTDVDAATTNASLRITSAVGAPGTQVAGGPLNFTIDSENWDDLSDPADGANATNVHIWLVPSDLSAAFSGATGTDWVCSPAVARPPAGTIECNLTTGPLPLGAAPTLDVQWLAPTSPGLFSMDVQLFADETDINTTDNQQQVDTTVVAAESSLRIDSVIDTPDPVVVGGTVDYDVTIGHWDDPGSAFDGVAPTGVMVDVTPLTPGAMITTGGNTDWTCMPSGPAGLICELQISLPVGTTSNLPVQATAPGSPGPMDVDFNVFANEPDPNTSDNNLTVQTTVIAPESSLRIVSVTDVPDPVLTDGTVDYDVVVEHWDDPGSTLDGAVPTGVGLLVTPLTPGVVFTAGGNADWGCSPMTTTKPAAVKGGAGGLSCVKLSAFPLGTTSNLPVQATAPSIAGPMDVDFLISANEPDPNITDNAVTEQTTVVAGATNASLTFDGVMDSPDPVLAGDPVMYTLQVRNYDDPGDPNDLAPANNVIVTVSFTDGEAFFGTVGNAAWDCSGGQSKGTGDSVACLLSGPLPPAMDSPTLDIEVFAPTSPPDFDVDFDVFADEVDVNTGDNFHTENTSIIQPLEMADLEVVKSVDNDTPTVGDQVNFALDVRNLGPDPANNVKVVDTLPPGMTWVANSPAPWSCNAGALPDTVECVLGGPLAPTGLVEFPLVLGVVADTVGMKTNTAMVFADEDDPDGGNNKSMVDIDVQTDMPVTLSLAVTDTADPVVVGETFEYEAILTNNGPDAATNATVSMVFNGGISIANPPNTGWTCTQDGTRGIADLTCIADGPLAPGESRLLPVGMIADSPGNAGVDMEADSDETTEPVMAQESTLVQAESIDLAITKSALDSEVSIGDDITYILSVSNLGTAPVASVNVNDPLPAGFSFVSLNAPGWSCSNNDNELICSRTSPLAGDQTSTIRINGTASAVGVQTNTATVNSTSTDSQPGNNQDSAQVDVLATELSADLNVSLTSGSGTVAQGGEIVFSAVVGNDGPDAATGIVLENSYSDGLSFVGASGSGWTCAADKAAKAMQCQLAGTLEPGGSSSLELTARADASGTLQAMSTVSSDDVVDPDGSNNSDSSSVVSIPAGLSADLRMEKTADQSTVQSGGLLEYTLNITNLGPDRASGVRVTDTLPDGFEVAHVSAPGFSCNGQPQLDCLLDQQLPSGESVALIISGVATLDQGTLENTASVESDTSDPQADNNTDKVTTNVQGAKAMADVSIGKTVDRATANVGDELVYTLTLRNDGPDPAANVQLIDTLPDGVSLTNIDSAPLPCGHDGPVISCQPDGDMASGEEYIINVSVTADRVGQLLNSASASADTEDPNTANNEASADTMVGAAQSDLSIDVVVEPTTASPGDLINVSVEVLNSGPAGAPGVTVIDEYGPGLDPVLTAAKGTQCNVSSGVLSCRLGEVPSGQTASLNFSLLVGDVDGSVTNTVRVISDNEDPTPGDAETTTQITIVPRAADLVVAKTASVSSATVGESFDYIIDVSNLGPEPAENVILSDLLPANIVVDGVSGSISGCSQTSDTVSCNLGTVAVNESLQLILNVHGVESGVARNIARIESTTSDLVINNNESRAAVFIADEKMADLSLQKQASDSTVVVGETFGYQLMVQNHGPNPAVDVVLTDTLPVQVSAISASGAGWSCTTDGQSIDCRRPRLASDNSASVNIVVRAEQEGTAINAATVHSNTLDPDGGNNTAKADVIINAPAGADLAVSKTVRDSDVLPGETVTFDLRVINNGPATATQTVLVDQLPASLSLVSVAGATCTGTTVLTCPLGDLAASQQVDITIVTTAGDDAGNVINTAAVSSDTPDPVPGNNQAQAGVVVEMPGEGEIEETINGALPSSATPNQRNNVRPLARLCARANNNNPDFCRALIRAAREGRGGEIQNALQNLVPEQVITQGTSVTKLTSAQGRNIESRLQQLRGGGGAGVSINGLTFRHGNESISLGLLQYLGEDEDEAVRSNDDLDGLISPWGFFINGMISGGDRDPTTNALGFDFETYGLTAGFDYRPSATSVMGLALGYASFDSDLQDGSAVDTKGYTLTGYGSFYPNERLFIDARISYGLSDFMQRRKVNFTLGDFSVDRTAVGKADGNDFSAGIAAGYNLYSDSWSFTPGGSLRYLRAEIDGFTETGAGAQNITYGEQDLTSLLFSANFSASKSISTTRGVITPQFDLAYHYEGEDDGVIIEAALAGANSDERFLIQSDSPDRHYGSAGVGLVFVSPRGRQFFLSYRSLLGLEGTTQYTVNFGGRFEFD